MSIVKLLHRDGRRDELKNFRLIVIISVICKLYDDGEGNNKLMARR